MAATEARAATGAILAAALCLPGLGQAENAPEQGQVAVKFLSYQDEQPGLKRIKVTAPSVQVLLPLGTHWSAEASAVNDSVSGASPRYHTAVSGASVMHDRRRAADGRVTHFGERSTWSAGAAYSTENDYTSQALSLDGSLSSEDSNTTWNVGLGLSRDRIGSSNDLSLHERRNTQELLLGLTQALSRVDLLQVNLTLSHGSGYYNDPYKTLDERPRTRSQQVLLLRWNHHLEGPDATLRSSYRHYRDDWGVAAHTVGLEWVQPLPAALTVTPSLRLHTQRAARFYYDPVYDPDLGAPYPPGYFSTNPRYLSADQRLSAFGALTGGLKLAWQAHARLLLDLKLEQYEQRGAWRVGGTGSPGLAPFKARIVQVGLSHGF